MEIKQETETKDCCRHEPKKGNMAMYILVAMIASVLLISVVQSFQIKLLKEGISGKAGADAVQSAVQSSGIDMRGWTENEKMMYEHHGTLPARLQKGSNQQNMAGGC